MKKQRSNYFHNAASIEYSSKAREYSQRDEEKWKTASFIATELSRLLTNLNPNNLLELGMGTGRYFPYLTGKHYTGVDISPEMLYYAKERKPILIRRGFHKIHMELNEIYEFLLSTRSDSYDFVFFHWLYWLSCRSRHYFV